MNDTGRYFEDATMNAPNAHSSNPFLRSRPHLMPTQPLRSTQAPCSSRRREAIQANPRGQITVLLQDMRNQSEGPYHEKLFSLVYRELRRNAAALLKHERSGHTLMATDLVHEVYMRLFDGQQLEWKDRRHFFNNASMAMRRILIDHARRQAAEKRLSPNDQRPLEEAQEVTSEPDPPILKLDRALERLSRINPRQGKSVLLRYFGGLTEDEVAELLEVSRVTVSREWRAARLWMRREMTP